MIKNNLLNEVKKYLSYLQFERKLSINTINSYWLDLKSYMIYIIDQHSIHSFTDIKHSHIKKYIHNISILKNN